MSSVFDVIIIGAGAGGGASAWALTQAGLKVLLLDAGPAYDPFKDYHLDKSNWEQNRFPDKLDALKDHVVAPLQKLDPALAHLRSWNHLNGKMVKGERRANWGYQHVRGIGGSTLHFSGEAHRLNPASMKMKSRFGVAADWPFDYDQLEPFYQQAEKIIGVSGSSHDRSRPRLSDFPLPAHPLGYASQRLKQAGDKLGLNWLPNSLAILSEQYDERPACNYCANCNRGCPRRDKGSVDVTFIHKALASGLCRIKTRCSVTRLETDSKNITAVIYRDAQGNEQSISAANIILAAGAVETPRLLLNSKSNQSPQGLANESGEVGKNFMETIASISSGLAEEALGSHRGLPADSICWDFNAPDAIHGVIGGCRFGSGPAEADLNGPINYANRVVGGWGRQHKSRMREQFGHVQTVIGVAESLPNKGTYIDLAENDYDTTGNPLARIHSRIEQGEIKRLEFMRNTCRDILKTADAGKMIEEYGNYDTFNATHVFGTCRMGNEPDNSVVNAFGRSHRWNNLYITDASVFPSSGGGEGPSLTIEALALRTISHMLNT